MTSSDSPAAPSHSGGADSGCGRKRVRHRSYADWITRAIQSAPDAKMTLANIYNWMACNVPGLYEKRNLHSSKGWKNAVRHTLSVNHRFKKCSQPDRRAAFWSLAQEEDCSPKRQRDEERSCFTTNSAASADSVSVNTGVTYSVSHSLPSVSSVCPSAPLGSPIVAHPSAEPMATHTLELHQQDGTVRTVTVPKPLPIHVVGEYRLVHIAPAPYPPNTVPSDTVPSG